MATPSVTIRIPEDLLAKVREKFECDTVTACIIAGLEESIAPCKTVVRQEEGESVRQRKTQEMLEDIKAGVETILNEIQQ